MLEDGFKHHLTMFKGAVKIRYKEFEASFLAYGVVDKI